MITFKTVASATIRVQHPSYSINTFYYGTKKIKRTETREWECGLIHLFSDPGFVREIQHMSNKFKPDKHCFKLKLIYYYPIDKFLTKSNTLSGRCHDLTNIEKPVQDILFDKKFHGRQPPFSWENLNIDDKTVLTLTSEKTVSPDENHYIDVELEMCEFEIVKRK